VPSSKFKSFHGTVLEFKSKLLMWIYDCYWVSIVPMRDSGSVDRLIDNLILQMVNVSP
jgi:hypothetical protein